MNELDSLIRMAARRLAVARFLETLFLVGATGLCGLLLWVILAKAIPAIATAWWIPTLVTTGIVLLISAVVGWQSGRDRVSVAVAIDTRLGLDDRFSTAVQLADRDDPFAIAAVSDAVRVASDPALKGRVRSAFQPDAPHGWWVASVLVVAIVGVMTIVPQSDVLAGAGDQGAVETAAAREQARSQVEEIVASVEQDGDGELAPEIQEALSEFADAEFSADSEQPDMTPDEVRREALRRVGNLEQQMQELLDGQEAQLDQTLRDSLSDLRAGELEDADAKNLAEALEAGDFGEALDAFQKLADKVKAGEMSDEERAQLEKELEDLAAEMERLANDAAALEEALRQAGLDGDLANDADALQKALENSTMSESRRQAIEEMMKSQSAASQALQNLSQSMQDMAQQCQQGQQGQQGEQGQQGQQGEQGQQGQQGQETLSQLESAQQMLQQAKATQGQCENAGQKMGSGLSKWAAGLAGQGQGQGQGEGQGQGGGQGGFGGRGRGGPGNAPIAPTPSGTVDEREKVENRGGDIIAREMIEGEVVVGESKVALRKIADRIAKGEEEGIGEDPVPPHLRDVHRHYFGEVEKRIRAVTAEEKPKADSPAAEPTESTAGE